MGVWCQSTVGAAAPCARGWQGPLRTAQTGAGQARGKARTAPSQTLGIGLGTGMGHWPVGGPGLAWPIAGQGSAVAGLEMASCSLAGAETKGPGGAGMGSCAGRVRGVQGPGKGF